MAAERGSAFLLKIGDGEEPPAYSTVAGLKTTQLSINGDPVAITNKDSGGWRELLTGAGVRSVSVDCKRAKTRTDQSYQGLARPRHRPGRRRCAPPTG